MIIVRQSTARTMMVGPILDADGVAVTDGVVGDLKISKNGGAPAALNGSATLTHRHTGFYSLVLTTSDTDTVGQAEVTIDDTVNAMPMKELMVIEEAVYDISFAASATGAVPVASIANNAITTAAINDGALTAAKIASAALTQAKFHADTGLVPVASGTAQAGSGTTIQLASATSFADDILNGAVVAITGGTGAGQARFIEDWVSATDTATVATWAVNPDNTSVYVVFFSAPVSIPTAVQIATAMFTEDTGETYASAVAGSVVKETADNAGGSALTEAGIADAVWDEAKAGHVGAGTFGELAPEIAAILVDTGTTLDGKIDTIDGIVDAIVADTNELQTEWADGGRLDLILDARASQASVDAIDDFLDTEIAAILAAVDTEVAAIKAKTDSLTFTVANVLDANVQRINDVALVGDGSGTPWGPA